MMIKKTASEIWNEYNKGIQYKTGMKLYDTVEKNENFYNGDQWKGLKMSENMPKPVFNFLKPVVNYYTAMLISDDIAANIEMMEGDPFIPKILANEIDNVMERANVKFKNRKMIRNCAVDGDACFYVWYDVETEHIKVDLVDNTNVYFGNPSEQDVQEQPYVILAYRRLTLDVRDEKGGNADDVVPDDETQYMNANRDLENEYTTVLLKLWKQDGTVWMSKTTQTAVIKEPTDTGYKLYPLAWMSWENVKNSYHGVSPVTAGIQNQIFVNRQFALAMIQMQNLAFPTILYDKARLPQGYKGGSGNAIGTVGPPDSNMLSAFRPPDMSAQVSQFIDAAITYTKDMMGAYDAALGNIRPENTSAIIAVQKAASMPLDIQRMDFYSFVESYMRVFVDIMRVNYGLRSVYIDSIDGERAPIEFDFTSLEGVDMKLSIEVGQAAYWSELTQLQTLDNLMDRHIIPDALTYLEAIPAGYLKGKQMIIDKIKEVRAEQEMIAQQQAMVQQPQPMVQQPVEQPQDMVPQDVVPQDMGVTQNPTDRPLSDEEIATIITQVMALSDEDAKKVIGALQISDEDKMKVIELYENHKGEL